MLKILVSYFSETGNTEMVAEAIYEEVLSRGHEVQLKKVEEITSESLNNYDLIFLGSACHSADLAGPVKDILQGITQGPTFRLAGFVTHSTYTPEGGKREQELFNRWASKFIVSFNEASKEKGFEFLVYFNCQGAPSPPIEEFIHNSVTDDDEWKEYIEEVRKHPNQDDLQRAQEFAQLILAKYEG